MRRRAACGFGATAVLVCTATQAADLGAPPARDDPFSPSRPVGIASEVPHSPLADVSVFATERFATVAEAQARCPRDRVVRVGALSAVYDAVRSPGQGAFMCKSSALSEGDMPH